MKNVVPSRSIFKIITKSILFFFIVFAMNGCLLLTKASPQITHSNEVIIDNKASVTLADRIFINKLNEYIREKQPNIEVSDGLIFRDAVFPHGGWKVEDLITKEQAPNIYEKIQIDYLILIRPYAEDVPSGTWMSGHGAMVGYASSEFRFSISTILIDIESKKVLEKIISSGEGGRKMIGMGLWVYYSKSVVDAVIEGLSNEIIKVILKLKKSEKTRIVIMSLEEPIDISKQNINRVFEPSRYLKAR